jgi:hypothetical protein
MHVKVKNRNEIFIKFFPFLVLKILHNRRVGAGTLFSGAGGTFHFQPDVSTSGTQICRKHIKAKFYRPKQIFLSYIKNVAILFVFLIWR